MTSQYSSFADLRLPRLSGSARLAPVTRAYMPLAEAQAQRVILEQRAGLDTAFFPRQPRILVINLRAPLAHERDSVKVLLSKNLATKEIDPTDTRSYSLTLTAEGKKIAEKASFFASSIEEPIEKLTQAQKETMLNGLLKLIYDLNKSGIITIQRMCFTCVNYQLENGIHYCKLLKSRLAESELRVDCPEHELI